MSTCAQNIRYTVILLDCTCLLLRVIYYKIKWNLNQLFFIYKVQGAVSGAEGHRKCRYTHVLSVYSEQTTGFS